MSDSTVVVLASPDTSVVAVGYDHVTTVAPAADIHVAAVNTDRAVVIEQTVDTSIVITPAADIHVAAIPTDRAVVVSPPADVQVVSVGAQGPPGVTGPVGSAGATALEYIAAITLSGHRMVVLNGASQAIYADNTIAAHGTQLIGLTTGATNAGGLANIQTSGEITEPTWNWTLGTPVYLGINGLLTQAIPVPPAKFSVIVGIPMSATVLLIGIKSPIFLV
jgi:hypothetical protein